MSTFTRWILMLLCCVICSLVVLLSMAVAGLRNDTFNTLPDSKLPTFRIDSQAFWQYEAPQREGRYLSPFIFSGGFHTISATLTSPAFATEAFVQERLNQSPTAITYDAIANDVCWTIISGRNAAITGWTRVGVTAYYFQCEGDTTPNQPALPANSTWLMGPITITNSAIVDVVDMSTRRITGAITFSTSRTISKLANWYIEPSGVVTIPTGITLTMKGQIFAACLSGISQIVLEGTGLLLFDAQRQVCPEWWGAYNDNTNASLTVAAINNAVESLQTKGGVVFLGVGTYKIAAVDGSRSIWVKRNNISIVGTGASSVIQTTANLDTAICISPNSDCGANVGTSITNVTIKDITIRGTGVFAYSSLLGGRGILAARATDLLIQDNFVFDMSMIGIVSNGGNNGYIKITGNRVDNCFYTGINYNGRAYQSIISNNIVSRSLGVGTGTPVLIQADGHAIITGNTVYNSTGYGISHGEGNYYGITIISNNLVKKTLATAIIAQYHGPVSIIGNTVINANAGATSAIFVTGATAPGLTVPVQSCLVEGNLIINSLSDAIYSSANGCSIMNNKVVYIAAPLNPTITSTDVDYIETPGRMQSGIRIQAEDNYVSGNSIDGAFYAIKIWNGVKNVIWGYNQSINTQIGELVGVSSAGAVNSNVFPYSTQGGRVSTGGPTIPTIVPPFVNLNTVSYNTSPTSGNPEGWVNIKHVTTNTTASSVASTTMTLADTTGILSGDGLISINTQGDYAAQYRVVDGITDGTHLTVTVAITCNSGELVYTNRWKPLANIP